jgi:cytochrome b pre-mRNA-processing protein 3
MLSLVVALIMRRLKTAGDSGRVLSQQLFNTMFADMDLSLREMGAGDIGVSKRVRVMAEAFMGRLDAYVVAIDAADRPGLSAALTRNLFRGNSDIDPLDNGLVDAIFELVGQLDNCDDAVLLDGRITTV